MKQPRVKSIGIYNPYISTMGGGEKVCLALAETLASYPNCRISIITYSPVDLTPHATYFQLKLDNIDNYVINLNTVFAKIISKLPLPGGVRNYLYDIITFSSIKRGKFDLFINNCYQSNLPSPSPRSVYMCMFPQKINSKDPSIGAVKRLYQQTLRTMYKLTLHPGKKHAVYTYDLITANSAYTQGYTKKMWGRDSEILYPICDNMLLPKPLAKEKIILNVGRFFENTPQNHHKRQDALLKAFAGLKDLHAEGWQLHLAGSVAEDIGTLKYILELMKEAQGLPVYFHFNSSYKDLRELYNKTRIYWHATGYGSNVRTHPERQEHFGIATVEAMSTGSIPVVINTAGQKESVVQGENGFLWDDLEQLDQQTRTVASMDTATTAKFAAAAVQSARTYDKQTFEQLVKTIFGDFIN